MLSREQSFNVWRIGVSAMKTYPIDNDLPTSVFTVRPDISSEEALVNAWDAERGNDQQAKILSALAMLGFLDVSVRRTHPP